MSVYRLTHKSNICLLIMLVSTGIFNIVDYFITLDVLQKGFDEFNPIINKIVNTPLFPLVKLLIIPLGLFFLWHVRYRVGKRIMAYVASVFFVYGGLMIYFISIYSGFFVSL